MIRRTLTVACTGLLAAVAVAAPALASWNSSGTGTAGAAARVLQAPATASAAPTVGSTSTSITVSWTAPSAGPAPTQYRVDRVSPAGTVCTVPATTFSCNDPGRTAGTSYAYNVYALISNWDGTAAATSASTGAGADTTAPVLSANCPTARSYATGNNGGGSWSNICGTSATVNATDAVGTTSAAIRVEKGTSCWSGSAWTVAACSAAGPAGYPVGYRTASSGGGGTTWSIPLTQPNLVAGGTGSYTLRAIAKDAAGNTSSTLAVAFSTT